MKFSKAAWLLQTIPINIQRRVHSSLGASLIQSIQRTQFQNASNFPLHIVKQTYGTMIENIGIQEPARFRNTRERKDAADTYLPVALEKMEIKPGEILVDFGCGPGALVTRFFGPWAEKTKSSVVGVDLSEKMIEFCRKSSQHPSATYVSGNINSQDFPITESSIDKLFSVWVFQYIKDYSEIFKQFYKLLKPGGQIWIMEGGDERYYNYFRRVREDPELSKYIGGLDVHPLPEWCNILPVEKYCQTALKAAGFRILQLDTTPFTDIYDNIEDCIDVFTCSIPNSEKLPQELRQKLNDICRDEFMKWPGKVEPDRFSYEFKLMRLWAEK